MIRRMGLVVLVAAALIALIIYSQIRSQPSFVSGVVEADEIRVGSRVAGRVEKVFVNEGDHVTAGTPLVAVPNSIGT